MTNINEKEESSVKGTIIKYSAICAAIAIQPIPFADIFILTPIQAIMGIEIAKKYGIRVEKKQSSELIRQIIGIIGMGLIAQQLGIAAAKTFWPIVGSVATIPVVFGLTYGIGSVINEYYKSQTNNDRLTDEQIKDIYKASRNEGQNIGRNFSKEDILKIKERSVSSGN